MQTAVLFDLDGTLHDRRRGLPAFAADQFERYGGAPNEESDFVRRFIELDAVGRVWKDRVYDQLCREFALSATPQVLTADFLAQYSRFAVEIEGSVEALQTLKGAGVKIGIVTNGRGDLQRAVIAALGFAHLLDAVVISEEVGCRKPQPAIFTIALETLAVGSESAVMVGDNPAADIAGALDAGLRAIGFACAPTAVGVPVAHDMEHVLRLISAHFPGLPAGQA